MGVMPTDVPKISIIMPLYNKASEVLASVASVRAQTLTAWELVVVDDGSTDGGADLVRDLGDPRIRVVSQANQGVSAARNRGMELASAELIAFLDADDEWRPRYAAAVLALAQDFPQAAWFATGYQIRHPRDGVFDARLRGAPAGFQRGLLDGYFQVAMQSDPPVWSSAAAVRRSGLRAIGGFPAGITSGEDLLTWARLAVRFPLAYDRRPLAVFNVSGHDRQADPAQRVRAALTELVAAHPEVNGLPAYLGLWCRMQAVMAMRFGESTLARRCAWQAVLNGPGQWRNLYTLLLACLPCAASRVVDKVIRHLAKHTAGKMSK
jgi:glycosyltransferase involved in cell wall biosynthesis